MALLSLPIFYFLYTHPSITILPLIPSIEFSLSFFFFFASKKINRESFFNSQVSYNATVLSEIINYHFQIIQSFLINSLNYNIYNIWYNSVESYFMQESIRHIINFSLVMLSRYVLKFRSALIILLTKKKKKGIDNTIIIHCFTIFLPRHNILPAPPLRQQSSRLFPSRYLDTIRSFDNNHGLDKTIRS